MELTLELTPEVAQELRRRRPPRHFIQQEAVVAQEESSEDEDERGKEETSPAVPEDGASGSPTQQETEDASTVLSWNPPPTRPLIVVHTERLIGYQPSSLEERTGIAEQVRMALFGKGNETNDDADNDAPADEKNLQDMFESQIAFHSDTEQAELKGLQDKAEWILIEYPKYLCWSTAGPSSKDGRHIAVLSTTRLWKSLFVTTGLPPVDALLVHVRECARPLTWKSQMCKALRRLGRSEAAAKQERQKARALHHWKTRRSAELEKLYSVRETLAHNAELEQQRLSVLLDERDKTVAAQLRRARMGMEQLDFTAATSVFLPENHLVPTQDETMSMWDALNGNDNDDDDNVDTCCTSDERGRMSETGPNNGSRPLTIHLSGVNDAKKDDAAYRRKLELASAEEEAMRESCTTNEMKTAMAIVQALKDRLAKTDELLESLQEEEWTAEEECEKDVDDGLRDDPDDFHRGASLSLLDQVLAMVLSATPAPIGSDESEHLTWKNYLHETTILDWKSCFGRLPPAALLDDNSAWDATTYAPHDQEAPSMTASHRLKESLGLVDNTIDNWEDWDDWTEDGEQKTSSKVDKGTPEPCGDEITASQTISGLRPGGRLL